MKRLFITFFILIMTITLYSQNNQIQSNCNPLIQLNTFYKSMVLYKPVIKSDQKLIKYNMNNFYHNLDLYKNYMKLPYNKFTYKKYGWDYYNGKPEWVYFGKYPRFTINF